MPALRTRRRTRPRKTPRAPTTRRTARPSTQARRTRARRTWPPTSPMDRRSTRRAPTRGIREPTRPRPTPPWTATSAATAGFSRPARAGPSHDGRPPRALASGTPASVRVLDRKDGDALDFDERAGLEQPGDFDEAHRGVVRAHAGAPALSDGPLGGAVLVEIGHERQELDDVLRPAARRAH